MREILDLIAKLRAELETCRNGDNDTDVMNAVQTLNKVDNLLLKQSNDHECEKCGECLEDTSQEELDMFGGLCENCTAGL